MSDVAGYVLLFACIALVLLPPSWDPAIRLKEWMQRRNRRDR